MPRLRLLMNCLQVAWADIFNTFTLVSGISRQINLQCGYRRLLFFPCPSVTKHVLQDNDQQLIYLYKAGSEISSALPPLVIGKHSLSPPAFFPPPPPPRASVIASSHSLVTPRQKAGTREVVDNSYLASQLSRQ